MVKVDWKNPVEASIARNFILATLFTIFLSAVAGRFICNSNSNDVSCFFGCIFLIFATCCLLWASTEAVSWLTRPKWENFS